MSELESAPAAETSSWTDNAIRGAELGAGIGFASPIPGGTVLGGVIGGAAGAASALFSGLFDDGPAPAAASPAAPAAAPAPPTLDEQLERETDRNGGDLKTAAGKLIKDDYLPSNEVQEQVAREANTPLKLETGGGAEDEKKNRLEVMNKLHQNDGLNPEKESQCGASALLAGMIYAEGGKGVGTVIASLEAGKTGLGLDPKLTELKEKLAQPGAAVTPAELQYVQGRLYDKMQSEQQLQKGEDGQLKGEVNGLTKNTMEAFLQQNPAMAGKLKEAGVQISNIDNDGDKQVNHYILKMMDKSRAEGANGTANTVYDPYARKGGQVVTDPGHLRRYNNTRSLEVANP